MSLPSLAVAGFPLLGRYTEVRAFTKALCEPLATEDYVVQSMADVSPTKWHLAHTSWFFETFILRPHAPWYRPIDEAYAYLFNSYYVRAGERHCRAQRGYISRPTVAEVFAYRRHVDEAMERLLTGGSTKLPPEVEALVTLGLNHEQQHQELMVTDIKHVLGVNPLRPAYRAVSAPPAGDPGPIAWLEYEAGIHEIGHDGVGFAYDNEGPRHRVFVEPYALANRPVTNAEYLEFIEDGGYRRPELWLSMGWAAVEENEWEEPFYWERRDGAWWMYTLGGMQTVASAEPVCHLTYFEADAFARWAGARLPTEFEWETVAVGRAEVDAARGNFAGSQRFHPAALDRGARAVDHPEQLFGDVWEWTSSHYSAYPGFRPAEGAVGEYNGKFMCNQFVLRGGSCATPPGHIRATYRNFFPADAAWQFTGLRLARSL